ncbi:HAD family phosphatase [Candidatus Daviesbacteria bacterium]|nr:HAD family phosphatase [Candidatus Daviesbacteria bacterium]
MSQKYIIDSKKIKALLFDWDGTLVDTEILQNEAYSRFFAPLGIKYLSVEEHIYKLGGRGSRSVYEEFVGVVSDEEYEKFRLKRREHYLDVVNEKGVKIINGVLHLITSAKKFNMKIGIVTGGSKDTLNKIFKRVKELPLKLFDTVIYYGDYKNTKPHPEPYLLGAKNLNIKPEQCLVFEDSPNGIRSATKAGMDYFAITHNLPADKFKETDPKAKTIKDFTQIKIK